MNELKVFENSEFGELGVLEVNGKPYFPATACARILGYANQRDAISRHCKADGVVKHDVVTQTTNQHGVTSTQTVEMKFISEGNLYIMTVPVDNTAVLTYGASREDVKEAMGKVRRMERLTKEALKVSAYPAFGKRTALELVMEQAHQSKTARIVPSADPKVLELQRPDEEPLLRAVAGGPDLDVMNRNALKRKGGNDHE